MKRSVGEGWDDLHLPPLTLHPSSFCLLPCSAPFLHDSPRPPGTTLHYPMPFQALGLEPRLLSALKDAGYTEPTPIQSAVIPKILSGTDAIGIAQTGTGKTAAFVLPMLQLLAARPPIGSKKIR